MERRPYYHRFAWAYDLLNAEPIAQRVNFIIAELRQRGVQPPAKILDAGCGTGRYAIDLAARGFAVLGVDQSTELTDIARKKTHACTLNIAFSVADLREFDVPGQFMAVLCRGVLNDITRDIDRERIFHRFAQWLPTGGVLIADVRDWEKTAERYEANSSTRREVRLKDDSVLIFTSQTSLDYAAHRLCVRERFEHQNGAQSEVDENEFSMRCWSRIELCERMTNRFEDIAIQTTYGENDTKWKDRLVVIAKRASSNRWQVPPYV